MVCDTFSHFYVGPDLQLSLLLQGKYLGDTTGSKDLRYELSAITSRGTFRLDPV